MQDEILSFITISPAPNRREGGLAYSDIHDIYQKERIMKALNRAVLWHKFKKPLVHFEYNKRMQIHAHFVVSLPIRETRRMQVDVCKALGKKGLNPDICCNVCPSERWKSDKFKSWEEYINKENILPVQEVKCTCPPCRVQYDKKLRKQIDCGEIVYDDIDLLIGVE